MASFFLLYVCSFEKTLHPKFLSGSFAFRRVVTDLLRSLSQFLAKFVVVFVCVDWHFRFLYSVISSLSFFFFKRGNFSSSLFFLLIDIKSLSAALEGAYIMLWPGSVRLSRLRNLQKWSDTEKWKAGERQSENPFANS